MTGLPEELKKRGVHQLLRTTLRGHKRPDLAVDSATLLVHTTNCTYALDDDGICRDVIAVAATPGVEAIVPRGAARCRGAQYVACLDMRSDDGLVGEPRVGGALLFVGKGTGTRMALLKTARVVKVEEYTGGRRKAKSPAPLARWSRIDTDLVLGQAQSTAAVVTQMMLPRVRVTSAAPPRPVLRTPGRPKLPPPPRPAARKA